jgi:BolA protein
MSVSAEIRERLEARFSVQEVEVIDESDQHIGHAGYQEGGESHFRVRLRAPELAGMTRIARHRAVHQALGPELISRIHALALELSD